MDLIKAVQQRNYKLVKEILKDCPNKVNFKDNNGKSALMNLLGEYHCQIYCYKDYIAEIADILIEHSYSKLSIPLLKALRLLWKYDEYHMFRYYMFIPSRYYMFIPSSSIIVRDLGEIILQLTLKIIDTKQYSEFKTCDEQDSTILIWAIRLCHAELIKLILPYSDVNHINKQGYTTIHEVIRTPNCDFEIFKQLISHYNIFHRIFYSNPSYQFDIHDYENTFSYRLGDYRPERKYNNSINILTWLHEVKRMYKYRWNRVGESFPHIIMEYYYDYWEKSEKLIEDRFRHYFYLLGFDRLVCDLIVLYL